MWRQLESMLESCIDIASSCTNISGSLAFESNSTACYPKSFGFGTDNAAHDWLTFDVPESSLDLTALGFSISGSAAGGKYGLVLPEFQFLLSGAYALAISSAIGAFFALILYHFVVTTRRGFLLRSIIGLLVLLASAVTPYVTIHATGIQNTAVRFILCSPCVLFVFRTLEALFGFVPKGAYSSLKVYVAYFCLPVEMLFDKESSKPINVTNQDLVSRVVNLLRAASTMSIFCSVLSAYDYMPFEEHQGGEFYEGIKIRDYMDARHLVNCFFYAMFFQSCISFGDANFGLMAEMLTGHKVMKTMNNPMLTATSPSDFWGRKWNVLVHSVMKRGVYKPVRTYASSTVAALAVFVTSGLFHEVLVHAVCIFQQPGIVATQNIVLGSNSAFFIWNFFVIMGEKILGQSKTVQSVGRRLPRCMVTFLIIMCSLPFAHWFSYPYMRGGFFSDYEKFLPIIKKLQ